MTDIEMIQRDLQVERSGDALFIRSDAPQRVSGHLYDAVVFKIPALGLAAMLSYIAYAHHQYGFELILPWMLALPWVWRAVQVPLRDVNIVEIHPEVVVLGEHNIPLEDIQNVTMHTVTGMADERRGQLAFHLTDEVIARECDVRPRVGAAIARLLRIHVQQRRGLTSASSA